MPPFLLPFLPRYDSELEYLDDQFSALVQRIQLSAELAKQRVKSAEVEEQLRSWERPARRVNTSELQAKVKLIEGKIGLRLGRQGKLGTPRLEGLCQQLKLDVFEKSGEPRKPSKARKRGHNATLCLPRPAAP